MGQRGMVTGREFAALQDQVLALTEEVTRMTQAQAATMVTQEQSVAQAQAATMVTDPPHTPQFEESPLETMETDVITLTASENLGNVGSGLEEDFPDQDLRALAGRAAEKLLLEWPELSESYGGRSRRQRPLPRFPEVAEEVHSTWGSPLSAPDPVQDFSSVMNVDRADKDGYLQFPPSLFQKAYLSAGEGCCALNTLGLLQAYQVALLHDLPATPSASVVMEIRQAVDMAVRLTHCVAQAMGRAMGACVVGHRHLWLIEAGVSEGDRMHLLNAPYTPGKAFVGAEPNPTESLSSDCNGEDQFTQTTEMAPVKLEDCSQTLELIVKVKEEDEEEEGYGEFLHTEITSAVLKEEEDEEESNESVHQRDRPSPCSDGGGSISLEGIDHHDHLKGKGSYCSPQPGQTFSKSSNLKRHERRIHTGEKQYATAFRKHEQHQEIQGEEEGHFLCSQCGKSFSQSADFKVHQWRHTIEKPYQCSHCGKRFSHSGHLKTHQRIHTGEKPYNCSQCGKSFSRSGYLKQHQRTHTGEKPYHCSQCGNSYIQLGALKTHQRIHTGEKPYHCFQCGKDFSEAANLKRHQIIHTGEKPYPCTVCNKNFNRSGNLKIHQSIHTKEKHSATVFCI